MKNEIKSLFYKTEAKQNMHTSESLTEKENMIEDIEMIEIANTLLAKHWKVFKELAK